MIAISLGDWGDEAPRELLVAAFITVSLGWFSHRLHQLREATEKQRHEEQMEAHRRVHEHLGIEPRKPSEEG